MILPIYHSGVLLRRSLAALQGLHYRPERFEVFVPGPPDNADARGSVADAAAGAPFRLEYVATDAPTRAAAINAAITAARGRYLTFADDDVFVEPDWLERLDEVFKSRPDAGLVGGVDVMTDDVGIFDLAFDAVLHSFLGSGRVRAGRGLRIGCYYPRLWNMALPLSVAMEAAIVGQDGSRQVFKAALLTHEDVELGERIRRLGRAIVFAPEVKVRHRRETTFAAMVHRDFRNAQTCRVERIHPWPHRFLSGALAAAAILAIGSVFWRPLWMALAIMAIAYGVVLIAVGISAVVEKRRAGVLLVAPIIAASLHLARAAGYIVGRRPDSCRNIANSSGDK